MKKSILALCLIVLFAGGTAAAMDDDPAAEQTAGTKAGYALLDKLTGTFKQLAETGTGGRAALEKAMGDIITEARQARTQKQIDPVFFWKFNRLMTIIQLAVVEDPKGILNPLIDREVGGFIEEVTGEKVMLSGKDGKGVGLGAVAGALAYEILNLRIYLDTLPKREAMLQDFYSKFPAPAKDK